jgi:hypothetical protein
VPSRKPTSKACIARAQAQTFRVQAINMNRLGSVMANSGVETFISLNPLRLEYSYNLIILLMQQYGMGYIEM